MTILAVIGIILLMGAAGASSDVSINLIILQALIGVALIAPGYIKILKEEIGSSG